MTGEKLLAILRHFRETHFQKPEYICISREMSSELAAQHGENPDNRVVRTFEGIPVKVAEFQSPTRVILCGKRFEERYIVTPAGDIAATETRMNEAAEVLVKIAERYTAHLYGISEVLQEGVTPEEEDELNKERVLMEYNYAAVCQLYELDEGAFIARYGKYGGPAVNDMDILMDVLIRGVPSEK